MSRSRCSTRAAGAIRTFRSRENAAVEGGDERRAFLGPPPSRSIVPAEPGLNRFEWDMRYPDASLPPPGTNLFGASVRGPQVVPGTYQVRLAAGGRTLTQPFEIRKDPRTSTTPDEFEKQFALLMQIHEKVTTAHDAIAQIIAARADLRSAVARAQRTSAAAAIAAQGKALDASLASVQDELVQMNIREGNDVLTYPAKLNNLIAALAPVVAATDTAPTAQSYEVFQDLSARLESTARAPGWDHGARGGGVQSGCRRAGRPRDSDAPAPAVGRRASCRAGLQACHVWQT